MIGQILAHIDFLTQAIDKVQREIELRLAPFDQTLELLQTLPGIKAVASAAILGEIGADMSRFPTTAHLASWAGLCPGNKESAGKRMRNLASTTSIDSKQVALSVTTCGASSSSAIQ